MRKEGTNSACKECGATYYVSPSVRKNSNYCSALCRNIATGKRQSRDLSERFWEKVDKSGDCWIWTGAMLKTGYGSIRVEKKALRAHRVAYTLEVGPIPDGALLRHSCDNPKCVNPAHLIPGNKFENTEDAILRGQHVCGEKHFRAKLSNSAVKTIKAALAAGVQGKFLADQFGVSQALVSEIKNGNKRRVG